MRILPANVKWHNFVAIAFFTGSIGFIQHKTAKIQKEILSIAFWYSIFWFEFDKLFSLSHNWPQHSAHSSFRSKRMTYQNIGWCLLNTFVVSVKLHHYIVAPQISLCVRVFRSHFFSLIQTTILNRSSNFISQEEQSLTFILFCKTHHEQRTQFVGQIQDLFWKR